MSLKPDKPYVFVHVYQYLAMPLEHAHILADCATVDYDYNTGNRHWKLTDSRMQAEVIDPEQITALIAAHRLKGTS